MFIYHMKSVPISFLRYGELVRSHHGARRDRKRRNLIRQRKEEAAERLGLAGEATAREL